MLGIASQCVVCTGTATKQVTSRQALAACHRRDARSNMVMHMLFQVERSLLPSKRHTSLKALLHLDNYDFFSDVNVADAQVRVAQLGRVSHFPRWKQPMRVDSPSSAFLTHGGRH